MEQNQELDIRRYLMLVVKRRYFFAVTAALLISGIFAVSYILPPAYEAKTIVSVEKSFLDDIMKNITVAPSIDDKVNALTTIMKSRTLVFKVISDMDLELKSKSEAEIEELIKSFQDRTDIKIEFTKSGRKDVDFFIVSFRHRNPKIARDYVNSLVGRYIEENLVVKKQETSGASQFLLEQMNRLKEKIGRTEMNIEQLRDKSDLVAYDRLQDLQKQLDVLRVQYTDDHPAVLKIKEEIAALKAVAKSSSGTSGASAPRGESWNIAKAAERKKRLAELERERDALKKTFEEVASAYGKSEVSTHVENQDTAGTFRIVDPAVLPLKPVSPDRVKIMLLGIVGGLGGALGLLVLLDMMNKSVKSVDMLKTLGVPVLAVIPHIQDPREKIRTRKKDAFLYSGAGLFAMLIIAVIVREVLG